MPHSPAMLRTQKVLSPSAMHGRLSEVVMTESTLQQAARHTLYKRVAHALKTSKSERILCLLPVKNLELIYLILNEMRP